MKQNLDCIDASEAIPLVKCLIENRPETNRPVPIDYSNYGFAIAGAIVARYRSLEWGEVMEQLLFPALGMTNGSFALPQNIPWTRLAPATIPPPFTSRYWETFEPAGAIFSCARDMHNYLQFLVSDGVSPVTGQRILSAAMMQRMRASGIWPQLGLGIVEERFGAEPIAYAHGGDLYGYSAKIHFVPSSGLYMFIVVGEGASQTRDISSCVLGQQLVPGTVPPLQPTTQAPLIILVQDPAFYIARNIFYGPLALAHTIGRISSDRTTNLATNLFGNVTLGAFGFQLPFSFQSAVVNGVGPYVYQFSAPRNDSDVDVCRLAPFAVFNTVNREVFFSFISPSNGWMNVPPYRSVSLVLGLLLAGAVGLGLSALATVLAMVIRRVHSSRLTGSESDAYVPLNDHEGKGKRQTAAREGGSRLYLLPLCMVIVQMASLACVIIFFVLYAQLSSLVIQVSVASGGTWKFVLALPQVILGLAFAAAVLFVALLIVRPTPWVEAKEHIVLAVIFLLSSIVLLLGFANVDLLF